MTELTLRVCFVFLNWGKENGRRWEEREISGDRSGRRKSGGQGPPFKRESSKWVQEVLLVTTAENIFCQDTRAGQFRCLNANIPPFYYKKVRWG